MNNPIKRRINKLKQFIALPVSVASDLDNAHSALHPTHRNETPKKLFIPTLSNASAISFWLGLVMVFSLYGVAVQFHHIHSFYDGAVIFFDFFVVQFCIVFAIVGYIHFSIDYYHRLSIQAQAKRTLIAALILTPPATLFGKLIEFFVLNDSRLFENIYIEILVDGGLSLLITSLLLYYFGVQYHKLRQAQYRYNQNLIEQNEQLKARITPHFFFNMLNTLQYLSETKPHECTALIEDISKLYRVSFTQIKEIALTDEIELCKHYLKIEQYRLSDKLIVNWDLPDEDLLYDMVITSLTLQMIIEKIILMVVEISLETIYLTLKIRWENDIAAFDIIATLPSDDFMASEQHRNLINHLNFKIQTENLQYYFGNTATITYYINHSLVPPCLITQIRYPLVDVDVLL